VPLIDGPHMSYQWFAGYLGLWADIGPFVDGHKISALRFYLTRSIHLIILRLIHLISMKGFSMSS
jgi:hypothetical protein